MKIIFLIFSYVFTTALVRCHPTMYKLRDNKLEPDLIPVSSTVIPLPVYKVSYGLNTAPNRRDEKLIKPDGPITLITARNNKKVIPTSKPKRLDIKTNNSSS